MDSHAPPWKAEYTQWGMEEGKEGERMSYAADVVCSMIASDCHIKVSTFEVFTSLSDSRL